MSKAAVNSMSRDVVAAEVDVHQPGNELVLGGVLVELDALHQRRGAVADADDRYADFAHREMGWRSGLASGSAGWLVRGQG